jgi:hypothetical protein
MKSQDSIIFLACKAAFISIAAVLLFLINYPKHLLYQLVAAVMTLTSTHVGVVRAIHYGLDDTVARIMLILNAFIRSANDIR